jgi:hypothetical protein
VNSLEIPLSGGGSHAAGVRGSALFSYLSRSFGMEKIPKIIDVKPIGEALLLVTFEGEVKEIYVLFYLISTATSNIFSPNLFIRDLNAAKYLVWAAMLGIPIKVNVPNCRE